MQKPLLRHSDFIVWVIMFEAPPIARMVILRYSEGSGPERMAASCVLAPTVRVRVMQTESLARSYGVPQDDPLRNATAMAQDPHSDFVIRHSFGFRVSSFGLRYAGFIAELAAQARPGTSLTHPPPDGSPCTC